MSVLPPGLTKLQLPLSASRHVPIVQLRFTLNHPAQLIFILSLFSSYRTRTSVQTAAKSRERGWNRRGNNDGELFGCLTFLATRWFIDERVHIYDYLERVGTLLTLKNFNKSPRAQLALAILMVEKTLRKGYNRTLKIPNVKQKTNDGSDFEG